MDDLHEVISRIYATIKADASSLLLNLGYAVGVLIIGWVISGLIERRLKKLLRKRALVDPTLGFFLVSLIRYAIMTVALVTALVRTGIETTSLVAVLGAAGLAIGLALQGTLSNIAAGVMLLVLRPIRVGETIELSGHVGKVQTLGLFTTELKRIDGVFLSIPNAQVWGREIINHDRNPVRRISVLVGADYKAAPEQVIAAIHAGAASVDGIATDPAVDVLVTDFADSAITYEVRAWCPAAEFIQLQSRMRAAIYDSLARAGIDIPFPQRVMHVVHDSGMPHGLD